MPISPNQRDVRRPYDIGVGLAIADLGDDRYRLTATVYKAGGAGAYNGGGTVVISREGHGEPLSTRFGERIGKSPKWGHRRLGAWKLPPITQEGTKPTSFSVETNGRGDFYAHLENVLSDIDPANNRSDKSNLITHTYYVDTHRWFYPDFPKSFILSRLHASSGFIEIPGLVPATGFGLPARVYGSSPVFNTRMPVALIFNDLNAISPYEHDVAGFRKGNLSVVAPQNCPPCEGYLSFRVEWEHDGPPEFLLGGDTIMRSLYKDLYWLPNNRPSSEGSGFGSWRYS